MPVPAQRSGRLTNIGASELSARGGRGLISDLVGPGVNAEYIVIDDRDFDDNFSCGLVFFGRDTSVFNHVRVYNCRASGNDTGNVSGEIDHIKIDGQVATLFLDTIFSNNDVPRIIVTANTALAGHDLDIYLGDFSPSVNLNNRGGMSSQAGTGPALP